MVLLEGLRAPKEKVGRFWKNSGICEKLMGALRTNRGKQLTTQEISDLLKYKNAYVSSYFWAGL